MGKGLSSQFCFMINLTGVESYNEYLWIFAESPCFTSEEKHLFYRANGKLFLFGEKGAVKRVVVDEEVGRFGRSKTGDSISLERTLFEMLNIFCRYGIVYLGIAVDVCGLHLRKSDASGFLFFTIIYFLRTVFLFVESGFF